MSLSFAAVPFARIARAFVLRVASAINSPVDDDSGLPVFVHPVATDRYKVTETENLFVYCVFYGPQPCDATTGAPLNDSGGGRHARFVSRRVRCYIYTRSGEDVYGTDDIALMGTDPEQTVETPPTIPGQWIAEEAILNALDDWQPVIGSRPMTLSPVHWVDPGGGPAERAPEQDDGLIRSFLDFQMIYQLAITNVEPAPNTLPEYNQNPEE